ncbi:MAG: aspartyl/asparaginyl beta-hydroxylase domain-containing protein [Jatrophihabitans sp.]
MPSSLIGTCSIDPARLAVDLEQVEPNGFIDSYDEFVCGSWRTCVLWNATGDSSDATIRDYPGTGHPTEYGRKLDYLDELMGDNVDLDLLRFARLTRLGPGTVVVPHRDYVELAADLTRIHLPLITAAGAYAAEADTVYHMAQGQIWFLDASRPHSIANFSDTPRIHLLLDFAGCDPVEVLRNPMRSGIGVPAESIVPRRPLTAGERATFEALSGVLDGENFMDVLAMLIRRYFVAELSITDVFDWMREIAVSADRPDLVQRLDVLASHALTAR